MTDGLLNSRRLNDKRSGDIEHWNLPKEAENKKTGKSDDVMECDISAFEGVLFHCGLISV